MSSGKAELLLALTRGGPQTLQSQIERQIRDGVRAGWLRPGATMPSTRNLAAQFGISRPLVMEAYAQLAAEGYLSLRQGAVPRVSDLALASTSTAGETPPKQEVLRYDLRPAVPDLSSFPMAAWLKASSSALIRMSAEDFGYSERYGTSALRRSLVEYLGRVRGVIAEPGRLIVTSGFEQGRGLIFRALRALGATRVAVENPGYSNWDALLDAGLELVPVTVDANGMRIEDLERVRVDAVMLTPAHQFPTGGVLSGERRVRLLSWLRKHDAIAIEDDYDAEFRYDRAPVGSLQGLDPDRVVYAGTASKTLAPALRLGWLVTPPRLFEAIQHQHRLAGFGNSRIEQHAFAEMLDTGEFDRHLRHMRALYRSRRDELLRALSDHLPTAVVGGISAGLHATVRLDRRYDEEAIVAKARGRGVGLAFMSRHFVGPTVSPSTLLLGYARSSPSSIGLGVRVLAEIIGASR